MTRGQRLALAVESGRDSVEKQRLAVYRRWLLAAVVVGVYLMLTVLTHYAYELHNPAFVLPHVGVLCFFGFLVARTLMAFDRLREGRAR